MRINHVPALFCAAALYPTAAEANWGCVPPTGEPNAAFNAALERYKACTATERKQAEADPLATMRERATADHFANGIIALGKWALGKQAYGDLAQFINISLASSLYTDEVKQGIRVKYGTFTETYSRFQATALPTSDDTGALISSWHNLRAELQQMRDTTHVDSEKALLDDKIREGDTLVENVAIVALLKSNGAQTAELKKYLADQLGVTEQTLMAKLDEKVAEIVKVLKADKGPGSAERNAQRIAGLTVLSQSLIGVAARAGIVSPEDAQRMGQIVTGVSQLATATALLQDKKAKFIDLAGAYGMGVGGALILASAFDKPEKSEGVAIMSMLKEISKQIADLQFEVQKRFSELSTQISQTEFRIMQRLSELLAGNELILTKLDQYTADMRKLRDELLEAQRAQQLQASAAFIRKAVYDDDECLKKFGHGQGAARDNCLKIYAGLTKDFLTVESDRLTSAKVDDFSGYEEQVGSLLAEYNKLSDKPLSINVTHRPTLDLIQRRLRLMSLLNPGLVNNAQYAATSAKLAAREKDNAAFVAAITDPEFVAKLQHQYADALAKALETASQRQNKFETERVITKADEMAAQQLAIHNEPFAMRFASSAFEGGDHLFAKAVTRLPMIWSEYNPASGKPPPPPVAFGIADKLDSYARIAERGDQLETKVLARGESGYLWVTPCDAATGNPSFAVARSDLSKSLPADALALTSVSKDLLTICYTPVTSITNQPIGIGNTTQGMNVVRQRIATMGLSWGYAPPLSTPAIQRKYFCSSAGQLFAQNYAKYAEYSSSQWESCHDNHIHHNLYVATAQVTAVAFKLSISLPEYQSPSTSVGYTVTYPNAQLDKCFLLFDNHNQPNLSSIILPFRQQYPLPIAEPCASIEEQLDHSLPALGQQLTAFLKNNDTTRIGSDGPRVTYTEALAETVGRLSDANYRAYLQALLDGNPQTQDLDRLSYLLMASAYFAEQLPSAADAWQPMNSAELAAYLELRLRDRDTERLHGLDEAWPAVSLPENTRTQRSNRMH